MADLAPAATNVLPVAGYVFYDGVAGETLSRGQTGYLDANTQVKKADSNNATKAVVKGIVLQDVAANQPVQLIIDGDLTLGAILTVGKIYVLSDTAGGIKPVDDLSSGEYVQIIGVATSTQNLKLGIFNSGAQVP